jgi:hypothetical protein
MVIVNSIKFQFIMQKEKVWATKKEELPQFDKRQYKNILKTF